MTTLHDIRNKIAAGIITETEFYKFMKLEGQKIDPRSADIYWRYASVCDPYGLGYSGEDCIGRTYFARSLGGTIWVEFSDLPDETRRALDARIASRTPPITVPFNLRVERMADAISAIYGEDNPFGEPDRARALEAAQAALHAVQELDAIEPGRLQSGGGGPCCPNGGNAGLSPASPSGFRSRED